LTCGCEDRCAGLVHRGRSPLWRGSHIVRLGLWPAVMACAHLGGFRVRCPGLYVVRWWACSCTSGTCRFTWRPVPWWSRGRGRGRGLSGRRRRRRRRSG
jgi:hypothetical protein